MCPYLLVKSLSVLFLQLNPQILKNFKILERWERSAELFHPYHKFHNSRPRGSDRRSEFTDFTYLTNFTIPEREAAAGGAISPISQISLISQFPSGTERPQERFHRFHIFHQFHNSRAGGTGHITRRKMRRDISQVKE